MPVPKPRVVFWIECVQEIGGKYYPRMYPFMTRAEADKASNTICADLSYSCVNLYKGKMDFPAPTRTGIRVAEALRRRMLRMERTRRDIERQHDYYGR